MSTRPNPFDFSNPVTDRSVLAGRGAEMKQASYYLDQSREGASYSLALIGERASGKTSLLNALADYAIDTGLVAASVRLDEGLAADDLDFFREVFFSLMAACAERGLFGGEAGAEYDTFCRQILHDDLETQRDQEPLAFGRVYAKARASNQRPQLSRRMLLSDLEVIVERCRNANFPAVVLLLDEGDVMAENHALLQALRNLLMDSRHFSIITAGTEQMFPAISEVFSPVPRQFVRINVGPFRTWRDTRKAILSRLLLAGQEWAMPVLGQCREIHSVTRGSPYEVMLVSHFAYREMTQTHQRLPMGITPAAIEAVAGQLEQQNPSVQETMAKLRDLEHADAETIRELIDLDGFAIDRFALARMDFTQAYSEAGLERGRKDVLQTIQRLGAETGFVSVADGKVRVDADSFQRALIKYVVIGRRGDDDDVELLLSDPTHEIADRVVNALVSALDAHLDGSDMEGLISELHPPDMSVSFGLAMDSEYSVDDYPVQATCSINADADWACIFVFRKEADVGNFRERVDGILREEAIRLKDFGVSVSDVKVESVDPEELDSFRATLVNQTDDVRALVVNARGAFHSGTSDFPGRVAAACESMLASDSDEDAVRWQQLNDCAFMALSAEDVDVYEGLSDRLEALESTPVLSRITRALWDAVQGDYEGALDRLDIDDDHLRSQPQDVQENLLMYSPAVLAASTPAIGYENLVGRVGVFDIVRGYRVAIIARSKGVSVAEALGELDSAPPWLLSAAADAAETEGRPEFAKELRRNAAKSVEASDDPEVG
jgi:hypothetical protein